MANDHEISSGAAGRENLVVHVPDSAALSARSPAPAPLVNPRNTMTTATAPTATLLAFHGKPSIKREYLAARADLAALAGFYLKASEKLLELLKKAA